MARRPERDIRVTAQDALEFEPTGPKKRGFSTSVWLLLVLVLVTGAGLGGFMFGDRLSSLNSGGDGVTPIVHAEPGPLKARPANPGGTPIPDQDKTVYQRFAGEPEPARVERLLPPPETPLEPPKLDPAAATAPPVTPDGAPAPPPVPTPGTVARAPLALEPPKAPETAAATPSEPTLSFQTVPSAKRPPVEANSGANPGVNQGGPISLLPGSQQQAAPPPVPATPPPVPQASASASPPPAKIAAVTQRQAKPDGASPSGASSSAAGAGNAAQTRLAAATSDKFPSAFQVQLAAGRSAGAAQDEWGRLRSKHRDLLGRLSLNVVRADLGAKGVFYRVRVGPLADRTSAKDLCRALSKRGQGCLVVAPKK